jgi:hypothetical protein
MRPAPWRGREINEVRFLASSFIGRELPMVAKDSYELRGIVQEDELISGPA